MALEEPHVVDAIGIERDSGSAVLTLIDSWDWTDEQQHMSALREKPNSYFNFIESGQIAETHPSAVGKQVFIDIIAKHDLPSDAQKFLQHVCDFASERATTVRFKQVPYASEAA